MRYKKVCFSFRHSRNATYVCLNPIVSKLVPAGRLRPGRRFSRKNQGRAQSSHAPPENAIRTLKALVLFSVLASDFMPLRMPTMMTRMKISPREQIVNDMLEMRFRESEVRRAWLWRLKKRVKMTERKERHFADVFSPFLTSTKDSLTSGRSRANPGNAAVQNVREHC